MGSLHKHLLICVLYNDTANCSDCLMLNMWWMGEELVGRRKYKGCIILFGYKPESRGFDSRCFHWNVSLTYTFRPHYVCGVDSGCNRNENQKCFLGGTGGRRVGLTTLLPSHVPIALKPTSLKLLETSEPVQSCNWIALILFYL